MKPTKHILIYIMFLAMLYTELINKAWPWVLLLAYIIFGILIFIWTLMPLIAGIRIVTVIKEADYWHNYNVIKFLVFTIGVVIGFLLFQDNGNTAIFNIIFLSVKIIISIILEMVGFLSLFKKKHSPSND